MLALITGGTSGIGLDIAKILDSKGYELIIVGSRSEFDTSSFLKAKYIQCDLTDEDELNSFLMQLKDFDLDVFIDNAGFGDIGTFDKTSDEKESLMIDLNIKAMHFLLKEVLKKMKEKNRGYVLVTSSLAAYATSGYMATYYATKAYSYSLALGYRRELKDLKSKVKLSVLCPGPTKTEFEKTANVKFLIKPAKSFKVAKVAVKKMFKGKGIIIPSVRFKVYAFLGKISPTLFANRVISKSARKR